MPPVLDGVRSLAWLWDEVPDRLRPVGMAVAHESAAATGGNGRFQLRARRWSLVAKGRPLAECRMVHIEGSSSEIVNFWVFPERPEYLPVCAAELIVTGGAPRLAFVDLQAPGLHPGKFCRLAQETQTLAGRWAFLDTGDEAPAWAVAASSGGHVYARPREACDVGTLADLSLAYLDLWIEWASDVSFHAPPDPAAAADLAAYKSLHRRHSPGAPYLRKLFGAEWTDRFLREFLYR